MNELPLTPSEKFFGALRSALIALRVPPFRAHSIVRSFALWVSVIASLVREHIAFARSIPAGFRLSQSELLTNYSTPCDRAIFHLSFVISQFTVSRDIFADIWREARACRAAWTPTSGTKGASA